MENFSFDISDETLRAIADMGYEKPTPIQEMTIEPLLRGRDLIGQAQTGTGKTAAFGIPMVEKVDASSKTVQALVLCPTRELAVQTAQELLKLGKYRPGLKTLAVYGGQPIERQLRELRNGVQIVVGTPGRVMDHLSRGSLDISLISMCVLDEADEMLDMGFRDDIESILSKAGEHRQTALFSATMPLPIMSLAQKYLDNPEYLKVENKSMTVDAIKQTYIQVRSFHKVELLSRLLVRDDIKRALVFMNTKVGVEDVVTSLQNRGFAAAGLHGDMRQIERDAIMARFKSGTVDILIATDVAARGLDIDNVEAVFNYDLPLDVEQYVHRIGRTGRAGKEGRAYTFVVGRELGRLWEYRRITKAPILTEQPPSGGDIRAAQEKRFVERALEIAKEDVEISENAKRLIENEDPAKTINALIRLLIDEGGKSIHADMDIRIPEPPKPAPKPQSAPAYPFKSAGGRPYDKSGRRAAEGRDARPYDRRPSSRPYERKNERAPHAPSRRDDGQKKPYGRDARPQRAFFDPRKNKAPEPRRAMPRQSGERGGPEEK